MVLKQQATYLRELYSLMEPYIEVGCDLIAKERTFFERVYVLQGQES